MSNTQSGRTLLERGKGHQFSGGNDYMLCGVCKLEFDYRKMNADEAACREIRLLRKEIERLNERLQIKGLRGVGIEGIASQIGALARDANHFVVSREELVETLCHRFGAPRDDVLRAIQQSKSAGVIREENGLIELITDEG